MTMPTTTSDPCDRCGRDLGPNHHDGVIAMSSTVNQRDVGTFTTFAAERERQHGFICLCDPCYREWHAAMRAWLRGASVRLAQRAP